MAATDEKALLAFFRAVPAEDRVFLKDDVTKDEIIKAWCRELDHDRILPLIAETNGRIVGDATLHQRRGGWMRHAGKIRVVIDPAYRGRGLGSQLIQELISLAQHTDLEKLDIGLMEEQKAALSAFQRLGFVKLGVFPEHVKDLYGKNHKFVVLVHDLRPMEAPF